MSKQHWKERYGKDGICDFHANYDFYFKWLLSKTCSCIYIKGLPETLDEFYVKSTLLTDGAICITDFDGLLYAILGAPGGAPDAYYKPTIYTAANPVLGSKVVEDGIDGVIIYNTPVDAYVPGGLYGLISQTATLLADNIISINCCQINSRVTALVTGDSKSQAIEAESTMKSIYAGHPYKVIPGDLVEKINVNPIASSGCGSMLTQLMELHNYITANYFQSIGIKANSIRKNAHVLQDEIDVQNDYLQISILEIMTSWQEGFDKVNEMYGTDIHVELNPALLDIITGGDTDDADVEDVSDDTVDSTPDTDEPDSEGVPEQTDEDEPSDVDSVPDTNDDTDDSLIDNIVEDTQTVSDIVDMINDEGGDDTDDNGTG